MLLKDADEAKRLREELRSRDKHELIQAWRAPRDRRMADRLSIFGSVLGEAYAKAFTPFQTQEADQEIQDRKHILVSNEVEVEVVTKSSDPSVRKGAQTLQDALDAVLDNLFPVRVQEDECDAILGDGAAVLCVEKKAQTALAPYADRAALERDAESPDEGEPGPAQEKYRAAYQKHRDHARAYKAVTDEALKEAGFGWQARVVDRAAFWFWEDRPGEVALGMEDGEQPLAPVLGVLRDAGWDVDEEGHFLRVTKDGKDTGMLALGPNLMPIREGISEFLTAKKVRYTRIADRENVYILIEHMKGTGEGCTDCESPFLTFDNIWGGRSTGYTLVPGNTRARGNPEERYSPVCLGQLVMAEMTNVVDSALLTMAIYEASRMPVVQQPPPGQGGMPYDATQDTKSRIGKDGQPQPLVQGEVVMEPTSAVPMMDLRQHLGEMAGRYRSNEYMIGSGAAGEPAAHLAMTQTAYLTTMVPIQERRAEARKRIIEDWLAAIRTSGETQYVPHMPSGRNRTGEIRVAQPFEVTPELASLPVDIRIKIGAESPATKWAREQAVRANVEFGVYGMTTGREEIGIKDPEFEEKRMAYDIAVGAMIGTRDQPGWLPLFTQDLVKQYVTQAFQAQYPPPPPQAPQPVPPGGGPPIPGEAPGPGSPNPAGSAALPNPVLSQEGPAGPVPTVAAAPPGVA